METHLASKGRRVTIGSGLPTVIIGERLNPTGKKRLAAALAADDMDYIRELALSQVAAGADALDVNVGIAGGDEVALLSRVVQTVAEVVDVPLCIDTSNSRALAAALRAAPGRSLVNSVNGKEQSLSAVLPLVKDYGAAVIGLTLDEAGIPTKALKRLEIAAKILERASQAGIPEQDVIIDCLVLPVGAEAQSGWVTLESIRLVRERLGVNVNLGASNVSFGMPNRQVINHSFVAMAMAAGMNCVIADAANLCAPIRAADLLLGRDEFAARYIAHYRATQRTSVMSPV